MLMMVVVVFIVMEMRFVLRLFDVVMATANTRLIMVVVERVPLAMFMLLVGSAVCMTMMACVTMM